MLVTGLLQSPVEVSGVLLVQVVRSQVTPSSKPPPAEVQEQEQDVVKSPGSPTFTCLLNLEVTIVKVECGDIWVPMGYMKSAVIRS